MPLPGTNRGSGFLFPIKHKVCNPPNVLTFLAFYYQSIMLYLARVTAIHDWARQEIPHLVVEWKADRIDIWAAVKDEQTSLMLEQMNAFAFNLKNKEL